MNGNSQQEAMLTRNLHFTGGETAYTSGTVHEITEKSHPIEREFYEFYRTPRGEFTPKGAAEPKELVYVKGAGHVDLYDRVNLIPWDKLNTFFKSNLK